MTVEEMKEEIEWRDEEIQFMVSILNSLATDVGRLRKRYTIMWKRAIIAERELQGLKNETQINSI